MAVTVRSEPAVRPPACDGGPSWSSRLKRRLLGPPLGPDQLVRERLGKPTALAVFASDNLSSSAYATEEILRVLVPAVGVAAFALVVPVTVAMLAVLGLLILSYRQTIKEYPSAGGAYVVTRDNFGLVPAQVAGVALLTDYVLTVSVSVAAGTAALASTFSGVAPYAVPVSVLFILLIAFGNLRGVRAAGRIFAVPTYFFMAGMAALLLVGAVRLLTGHLPAGGAPPPGTVAYGSAGGGLLLGASLWVVLHAFASGGAAVTGVEAVSNGVSAFRPPEWRNARTTLVVMGSTLGVMFLGLSVLAARLRVVPFSSGSPTVISQIGALVFGASPLGRALFYALQAGTMLILVMAANTSFADFPRLASFEAADHFLPRGLTRRGQRLVYSNGILALAAVSTVVVVVTDARVDRLIPLYAIGVFTSFTLSQAGMARHHLTHREPGWRAGLAVNGLGAVVSGVVDAVIATTKFAQGAWVVIVLVPTAVALLVRRHARYQAERSALERDARDAVAVPVPRRHVVLVVVPALDRRTVAAIRYARTLRPDDLRAVYVTSDADAGDRLGQEWRQLGLAGIPLEVAGCLPDVVDAALAGGDTEVTVLVPGGRGRLRGRAT